MLTRLVSRASVEVTVQHSNVVLIVGSGVVWKWSYTQTESHGPASAARATAVIASYCSTGSAISTRSIFHPWGTNTPKRTLMPRPYPAGPAGRADPVASRRPCARSEGTL